MAGRKSPGTPRDSQLKPRSTNRSPWKHPPQWSPVSNSTYFVIQERTFHLNHITHIPYFGSREGPRCYRSVPVAWRRTQAQSRSRRRPEFAAAQAASAHADLEFGCWICDIRTLPSGNHTQVPSKACIGSKTARGRWDMFSGEAARKWCVV
jgi:hypothetical protein